MPRFHLISAKIRRFAPTAAMVSAAWIVIAANASEALAQLTQQTIPGYYQPLDQTAPVGMAAQWMAFQGKAAPPFWQPIRVDVEDGGNVTFFNPRVRPVTALSPARAAVAVGHVYRLRISDIADLPGVELWPSIEILDRLHPPPGLAERFPIPVEITREEIELAAAGRLITKVVYLEQPELAAPIDQQHPLRVTDVAPHLNLLSEADKLGRPLLILRMGGRTPDPHRPDPRFFGSGFPILLPADVADASASNPQTDSQLTSRSSLTAAEAEFLRQASQATPGLKSRTSDAPEPAAVPWAAE